VGLPERRGHVVGAPCARYENDAQSLYLEKGFAISFYNNTSYHEIYIFIITNGNEVLNDEYGVKVSKNKALHAICAAATFCVLLERLNDCNDAWRTSCGRQNKAVRTLNSCCKTPITPE